MRYSLAVLIVLLLAACGGDAPASLTGNSANTDKTTTKIRAEYDGSVQEFPHVLAIWNERGRELGIYLTKQEIPGHQQEDLRRNGRTEVLEDPHVVLFFYLKKGAEVFSLETLDGHLFSFAKMSEPSPTVFGRKIGRESIKEFSGTAQKGAKVRVHIEFRGETYPSGGNEVAHIDFNREVTLQ